MQIENSVEYKKARLKFIFTAAASLLLMSVIVSCALLNAGNFQTEKAGKKAIYPDAGEYVRANIVLQQRLQDLDNAMAVSHQSNRNTDGQLKASNALRFSLDSLQKTVESVNSREQKADINHLLLFYRNALQTRIQLETEYASLRTQMEKSTMLMADDKKASKDDAELKEELQQKEEQINRLKDQQGRMLAEKDDQISSLTKQLQQAADRPKQEKDDGAAAWKQKFITLEGRFKELDIEYNVLSQSYQNAVSNNRKLLSQLQAGKKS